MTATSAASPTEALRQALLSALPSGGDNGGNSSDNPSWSDYNRNNSYKINFSNSFWQHNKE